MMTIQMHPDPDPMEIMESMLAENPTNQRQSYAHARFEWHPKPSKMKADCTGRKRKMRCFRPTAGCITYRLCPTAAIYWLSPDYCAFTLLVGFHSTAGFSPDCTAFTQLLFFLLISLVSSNRQAFDCQLIRLFLSTAAVSSEQIPKCYRITRFHSNSTVSAHIRKIHFLHQ